MLSLSVDQTWSYSASAAMSRPYVEVPKVKKSKQTCATLARQQRESKPCATTGEYKTPFYRSSYPENANRYSLFTHIERQQ